MSVSAVSNSVPHIVEFEESGIMMFVVHFPVGTFVILWWI